MFLADEPSSPFLLGFRKRASGWSTARRQFVQVHSP
jgi:hypothetical protein